MVERQFYLRTAMGRALRLFAGILGLLLPYVRNGLWIPSPFRCQCRSGLETPALRLTAAVSVALPGFAILPDQGKSLPLRDQV